MKKHIFIYLIIGLIIYSCSKDESPINPEIDVLGKWELTHLGNGSNADPYPNDGSYQEYLPDSVMRIHNVGEEGFIYQKYWFEDSLLFERATYVDAIDKDTTVFIVPYKYQFLDRNKLRLDLQNPATFTTSIYKRIK